MTDEIHPAGPPPFVDESALRGALAAAVRSWGITRVATQVRVVPVTLRRFLAGERGRHPTPNKLLEWCARHARDTGLRDAAAAQLARPARVAASVRRDEDDGWASRLFGSGR